MAKKNIAAEVAALIASGEASVVQSGKFLDENGNPIKVRQMESVSDPLEEGDTFVIPTDYQVLEVKFDQNDPDAKAYSCILCIVTSEDGSERPFRFFPNSLCKSLTPIIDGKRGAKVKTTGSASELYRTADEVDAGLALLKGKTIKVASSKVYTIKDYTTKQLKDAHIYAYDLVQA